MTKPTGNPRGRPRKGEVTRLDGAYENVFLGVGTRQDRSAFTRAVTTRTLSEPELTSLYGADGFARRIVDMPAEEMTRAGFEIEDLDEAIADDAMAALESVNAMQAIADAMRWSRLYGGAMVVMLANDGQELDQPLAIERVKGLERLRVYDRWRVTRHTYYDDPLDSRHGDVKTYQISPIQGTPYIVHESRCLKFDGAAVPDATRETNDGWGASALQQCFDQLSRFNMSHYWANALLERSQQAVHGIKSLSQTLRQPGGQEAVRTRIDLVDMARSVNNTVVIDADGETYELKSTSLAGVSDIVDRLGRALSAVTAIPETLLLGVQQKGLSNTGAGDLENWYASMGQAQATYLTEPIDRLVQVVLHAMGKYTPDYMIKFCPLWVPSDKEKAEVEKLEAEAEKLEADTAAVYVAMQALDPSEVRKAIAEEYEIDDIALEVGPIDGDITEDALPRTLYVSRNVINVGEIKEWAKSQGIPDLNDDLHVTITYSRNAFDWMKAGNAWNNKIEVQEGGPRVIEPLGNQSAVLLFTHEDLVWRHKSIIEAGASHDYDDYQPHISLTKTPFDIANVEPYRGKIILGPEIFEELKD